MKSIVNLLNIYYKKLLRELFKFIWKHNNDMQIQKLISLIDYGKYVHKLPLF